MKQFNTKVDIFIIKIVIVLSSLELFVYVFNFFPRVYISLFSLLLCLFTCFLAIIRIKLKLVEFLFLFVLIVFLLIASINSMVFIGDYSWAGTLIKYSIYLCFSLVVLKSIEPEDVFELISFLNYLIFTVLFISLIFGFVFDNTQILNGRLRFQGLTYTSSLFSSYCALSALFFLYQIFQKINNKNNKRGIEFLIVIVSFILSLMLCYTSGSRQPFYGLILTSFVVLFMRLHLYIRLLSGVSFLCVFIVLISLFFDSIGIDIYYDLKSLHELVMSKVDGSTYSRIKYFTVGVGYLIENGQLLLGSGLNSFPSAYYSVTGLENPASHNIFLTIIMNFGIVGFLFFFFIILYVLITINKNSFRFWLIVFYFLALSLNNPDYFISIVLLSITLYRIDMFRCANKSK